MILINQDNNEDRSNRTFMELKFSTWYSLRQASEVLIVPLWN